MTVDYPLLIAHRGATQYAPENSVEAIVKAVELGLDGVEVDVQATADGQLVCFHDETLERLTTAPRKVSEIPASRLRKVILRSPASDGDNQLTGHVLFYPDLLDITRNKMFLNIEIKGPAWSIEQISERLLEPLRLRDMTERVLISSFYPGPLSCIKKIAPQFKIGLLINPIHYRIAPPGWMARWLKPHAINAPHHLAIPRRIALWMQEGYSVFVWTVNDQSLYEKMAREGVKGVITDFPEKLSKAK